MIIAIDGPAGSGKSTVAKRVARSLGFSYLDTGAMYRAVTYSALANGLDITDAQAVAGIAETQTIEFGYKLGESLPSSVFIDGEDVTDLIRTPLVDAHVSTVSSYPEVRAALVSQQRRFGMAHDTVMEGRDIGTAVFPQAELKIFLTAQPEVRARRRVKQNISRKAQTAVEYAVIDNTDEQQVLEEILRRDQEDESREVSPLVAAEDSIEIDSTEISIGKVIARIVKLAQAIVEQDADAKVKTQEDVGSSASSTSSASGTSSASSAVEPTDARRPEGLMR